MSAEQPEINGTHAFSTIRMIDYKPVFLDGQQLREYGRDWIVFDPLEADVAAKEDHHEGKQFSPEFS